MNEADEPPDIKVGDDTPRDAANAYVSWSGTDIHGDVQTYVNVGLQFDDPSVSSMWFDLIKSDLKNFRGTIAT